MRFTEVGSRGAAAMWPGWPGPATIVLLVAGVSTLAG